MQLMTRTLDRRSIGLGRGNCDTPNRTSWLPFIQMTPSEHSPRQLMPVRFEFVHPMAAAVSVAGTFNAWRTYVAAMLRSGAGQWLWETVLEPGSYEYCLVVDGQWTPDPQAKDYMPNVFGGMNSVLHCAGGAENL